MSKHVFLTNRKSESAAPDAVIGNEHRKSRLRSTTVSCRCQQIVIIFSANRIWMKSHALPEDGLEGAFHLHERAFF